MHSYCRTMVKMIKEDIKEAGLKPPILGGITKLGQELYEVYLDDDSYTQGGCCTNDAAYSAYNEWLKKQSEG